MTIPYQENLLFMVMHQTIQEVTYPISINRALNEHEFHLATSTDRCNHVQPKACPRSRYDRCAPFGRPCFARVKIRPNPGFVFKINDGPFFLGALLNLWIYFVLPFFNQFRIFLVSTIQRFLTSKPKLTQQAPYRAFTKFDFKLIPNHSYNQSSGPKG